MVTRTCWLRVWIVLLITTSIGGFAQEGRILNLLAPSYPLAISDGKRNLPHQKQFQVINSNATPQIRAIMFDFDGTLADTLGFQEVAFGKMYYWITQLRWDQPGEDQLIEGKEFLHQTMGQLSTHQIATMVQRSKAKGHPTEALKRVFSKLAEQYRIEDDVKPDSEDDLVLGFAKIYQKVALEAIRSNPPAPLPGVMDLIHHLTEQGIPIYVGTGAVESVPEQVLSDWGVRSLFSGVYGAVVDRPSEFPKGKVDMLEKIRAAHGLREEEVAIFGDGKGDMEASKFGDRKFIAVGITKGEEGLWRKLIEGGADFLIPNLKQWRHYLERLGMTPEIVPAQPIETQL